MKLISVTLLRNLINQYDKEEISTSRFAEILNDQAASAISAMVEKERDEFAEGFAEWLWPEHKAWTSKDGKPLSELLTIYKEQNHGK